MIKSHINQDKLCIAIVLGLICLGAILHDYIWSSGFVVASWIVLIVGSCNYKREKVNPLNIENTIALRGVCALEILLGHVGLFNNNPFLFANRKAGILVVGVFFLLSGYGVFYGYNKKINYLNNFLPKRILGVLLPSLLVIFTDRFINILVYKHYYESMLDLFGFFDQTWYIYEICVLYVVFYICIRISDKNAELIMLLITMIFVISAYFIDVASPYYGSTLCFPLGMIVYKYFEGNYTWKWNKLYTIVSLTGLLISLAMFFKSQESFLGEVIARNIASVCFCIVVVSLLTHFTFQGSVIKWLGALSLEIYLLHEAIECGLQRLDVYLPMDDYMFLCFVLAETIFFALPLKCINRNMKSAIGALFG